MASEQKMTKAEARNMTIQLLRQAFRLGVKETAIDDYVTRAFNTLDVTCDAYTVHEWAARERVGADHLFEGAERQESGTPAARPQTQTRDYSAIKDRTARLTLWRLDEAQQKGPQR